MLAREIGRSRREGSGTDGACIQASIDQSPSPPRTTPEWISRRRCFGLIAFASLPLHVAVEEREVLAVAVASERFPIEVERNRYPRRITKDSDARAQQRVVILQLVVGELRACIDVGAIERKPCRVPVLMTRGGAFEHVEVGDVARQQAKLLKLSVPGKIRHGLRSIAPTSM